MSIHRYKPVVVTLDYLDYNDAISNESWEKEIIKQLSKADERLTKKMREIDLQEERSWARARIRNIGIFYESE